MALTKVDAQLVNGAITTDSSGNVGIGTSSPTNFGSNFKMLAVQGSDYGVVQAISSSGSTTLEMMGASGIGYVGTRTNHPLGFRTYDTERMRITSNGKVAIGSTGGGNGVKLEVVGDVSPDSLTAFKDTRGDGYSGAPIIYFQRTSGTVGSIATTTSSTSYNTASDYRLKENIAPMTGALNKVVQLKPVTYTWKVDGSDGEGFIAHELAEVVPDAVVGEKDAVDAAGNPRYQGIDTSFLVATLTAAIQELKAELDATKAEVAALKGAA